MPKRQVSLRLDREQIKTLDRIARSMSSTRNHLLTSAVENYLDLHRWQAAQIREGIREADLGKLIDHNVVIPGERSKRRSPKLGADRKRI